jgi:hypothetical protein
MAARLSGGDKMIKVQCLVTIYEIDGRDFPGAPEEHQITVRSHWNRDAFIELEIEGKRYTVVASDLEAAITNAHNTARFG